MLDHELGPFLRSRREALSPADVGLPIGTRRRTPGLRRSEVATLADISVDYLIRLEQGRDTRPSAQVLAAIAGALRLNDTDLDHLRRLSVISHSEELCPAASAPARAIRPTIQALLDRLEPSPAVVLNGLTDLLGWTQGYEALTRPLGLLDAEQPNLLRFTFGDARARHAYVDWGSVADQLVGTLQSMFRPDAPDLEAFVGELGAVGEAAFTERWARRPIVAARSGVQRLAHPEIGELRVAFETLQLADADDQRLIVHLPADEETAAALDRLTGLRPGGLRAVTG
jgi:transcriptional regulator with XRE-family HTH domain